MTEFELFQSLRPRYPVLEYALLPQTANGTGFGASRHCDAIALSLWPSRGLHVTGFEMKSYRGDWLREKRDPAKAEEIAQYCNYWYVVAANDKVCTAEEMPEPWGFMVYDQESASLKQVKKSPFREARALDIGMVCAILRKAQGISTPTAELDRAREEGRKLGKEDATFRVKHDLEAFEMLKTRLSVIEKMTGIDFDSWKPAESIADAIKTALEGDAQWQVDKLRSIARDVQEKFGLEDGAPPQKQMPMRRRAR